jgi:hypothetical protein
MAIDYDKLMDWPFEEVEQTYSIKDSILYALGVGYGHDPVDEGQLPFVFEEADFKAVPTMAVVLAGPGFWLRDPETGIDWRKILHGEQGIRWHKPLPKSTTVTARTRITRILDKGADKGALIYSERDLVDKATGDKLATLSSTTFARADGGFGGATRPAAAAARSTRARPLRCVRSPHKAASSAALSLVRRPQPSACRPEGGRGSRFQSADPPWPLYFGDRRTCGSAKLLRI